MKFTIEQITAGEDEVILRYHEMTPPIERIYNFITGKSPKIIGVSDNTQSILNRNHILYIESVDGRTFAYTDDKVYRLEYTLSQMSEILNDINFFRCSKSMIINIDKVKILKSMASNRIDATMCNGEHIIISRTYASEFRKRLKGVHDYE
jgi:DNA-binding LytR/AlgR family response regulator